MTITIVTRSVIDVKQKVKDSQEKLIKSFALTSIVMTYKLHDERPTSIHTKNIQSYLGAYMGVLWKRTTCKAMAFKITKSYVDCWQATINGVTWNIVKTIRPEHGMKYYLMKEDRRHFSDHPTVLHAKQYAENGLHRLRSVKQRRIL